MSGVCVPVLSVSDHYPVTCFWSIKLPKIKKNGHTTIFYRSFKNFSQSAFLFDLANTPFDNVFQETDPDAAMSAWYSLFLGVLNKHAPLREKRVKHETFPAWLTPEIIQAMEVRNDLRREKRFSEFKQQRNKVRYMVREARRAFVNKAVGDDKSASTLWRVINSLTRGSSSRSPPIPEHLTADEFNDHFLSVAETLLQAQEGAREYVCPDVLADFCKDRTDNTATFEIPPMTVHEVGSLISSLKNKKSSGPDAINPHILKLSLPFTVNSLTYIYNLCIQNNTFPSELKTAKVIPLPKTKELGDPNNYRPISLLSVLSKPLERHVHKCLTHYLETRNLLHPFQSGFRNKHSCHTALSRLTDIWLANMNNSLINGTIFLDFKKAFDLVDHEILLSKLHHYIINNSSLTFFRSYLENRQQKVLLNGKHSNVKPIKYGVPQGSILGPLLFTVFINDLPMHITSTKTQCDMFADDTSVHSADKDIEVLNHRLQQSLDEVSAWCQSNSMILHPVKTKSMVLATRQKHQVRPLSLTLSLHGSPVEEVAEHRLLGVTVDNQLSWKTHINTLSKTISKKLFMLSKLKHFLNEDSRKMFFNAHVRSHLDYASTVWDGCSDNHMKKLNSLHRRAAKIILPNPLLSTDEKLKQLGILPLSKHLVYNKAVFMYKIWQQKVPEYISQLFHRSPSQYGKTNSMYIIPLPRLDMYKSSLSFAGASTWNHLTTAVKSAPSLSIFKDNLVKYLTASDV